MVRRRRDGVVRAERLTGPASREVRLGLPDGDRREREQDASSARRAAAEKDRHGQRNEGDQAVLQAGGGESTDVTEAVARCVERATERAERARVTLSGEAPRGLVAAIAPPLMDAMLDNLTENAIRHAGDGADVRVTARGLTGAVEVQVSDTGLGIAPEHLPHVFERFYRVEGSRSGPGTGLGLAIVKHVAEAHGGRAEIESAEGRGTTVRVILAAPAARRSESIG